MRQNYLILENEIFIISILVNQFCRPYKGKSRALGSFDPDRDPFLRIEIGSTILFKSRIGIGSKLLLNSIRSFF